MLNINQQSRQFNVYVVTSEAEFREVWNYEIKIFKNAAASVETAITWWRCYSKGLFVVKKEKEFLGYLAFWPLTKTAFEKFVDGKILEPDLSSDNIETNAPSAEISFWYIGSIALLKPKKNQRAVSALISKAIPVWLSSLNPSAQVHLCALANSNSGERLLKRFAFTKQVDEHESPHKQSVYIKQLSVTELNRLLKQTVSAR